MLNLRLNAMQLPRNCDWQLPLWRKFMSMEPRPRGHKTIHPCPLLCLNLSRIWFWRGVVRKIIFDGLFEWALCSFLFNLVDENRHPSSILFVSSRTSLTTRIACPREIPNRSHYLPSFGPAVKLFPRSYLFYSKVSRGLLHNDSQIANQSRAMTLNASRQLPTCEAMAREICILKITLLGKACLKKLVETGSFLWAPDLTP